MTKNKRANPKFVAQRAAGNDPRNAEILHPFGEDDPLLSRDNRVIDIFDVNQIKLDLARYAESPGIYNKFSERLRIRFTKKK